MQHERYSMLKDLRTKANQALGTICEESISHPHEDADAGHLHIFKQGVA